MTIHHESSGPEPASLALLWFSTLGPPLAWVLHNVISYSLATVICVPGQLTLLHLTTALTALIALAAAILGGRALLRLRNMEWPEDHQISKQRAYFMAYFGLLSGIFFFVVILVEGIPNFYLEPCVTVG